MCMRSCAATRASQPGCVSRVVIICFILSSLFIVFSATVCIVHASAHRAADDTWQARPRAARPRRVADERAPLARAQGPRGETGSPPPTSAPGLNGLAPACICAED
jgi:hypothetical protein